MAAKETQLDSRLINIRRLLILCIVFGSFLGVMIRPVAAHPADMYNHVFTIAVSSTHAEVTWDMTAGPLLSQMVWASADQNDDGAVDTAEARAWVEPLLNEFRANLDNTSLTWRLESVEWPADQASFLSAEEAVAIHLVASWSEVQQGERHRLTVVNNFQSSNSLHWFAVSAEDIRFETPEQINGALLVNVVGTTTSGDGLYAYWDSGVPRLEASGEPITASTPDQEVTAVSRLSRLLRRDEQTPLFVLTSIMIALGLGAVHALTPGHGKALVGAYLVGSRGTIGHAIALGSIVTLTHTGSVLVLGALTLTFSHILLPTDVLPVLEIVSGVLVVAMGLILVPRRWRAWQSVRRARAQRQQARPDAEQAPVARAAPGGSGIARTGRITINQPIQVNVYNDVLPDSAVSVGSIRWRSLIALGISGGLVPCPDAIAILLVAVAINRIVLGLLLIVTFSSGLALVLTVIGIGVVRSQRLFRNFSGFQRWTPAMPLLSALVVTALGVSLLVTALQNPGGLSRWIGDSDNLVLSAGDEDDTTSLVRWERDSDAATRLIYLDTDEAFRYQLYVVDTAGDEAIMLTPGDYGVLDYQIAPDGQFVVYSLEKGYEGSDIWQVDTDGRNRRKLLACEGAYCTRATVSPDGSRLLYERVEIYVSETRAPGVTSLYWLDMATGETAPVFSDSELPAYAPSWSPDGQWLSFTSTATSSLAVHHLAGGESLTIPTQTGIPAIWSPDSASVLVINTWSRDETSLVFTHLLRYDLATGEATDLTGPVEVSDSYAAYSPDGTQIAVVRREGRASSGDQIWLLPTDGGTPTQITSTPDVLHGAPAWSPDGAYIAYHQEPLAGSDAGTGIYVLEVASGTIQRVSPVGNWMAWLP